MIRGSSFVSQVLVFGQRGTARRIPGLALCLAFAAAVLLCAPAGCGGTRGAPAVQTRDALETAQQEARAEVWPVDVPADLSDSRTTDVEAEWQQPADALAEVLDAATDRHRRDTREDFDLDTASDIPDTASVDTDPGCSPPCLPHQFCDAEAGICLNNPLCFTDYCGAGPDGMGRVQTPSTIYYVDYYEWPNQQDSLPKGGIVSREEAASLCLGVGKRLCSVLELTKACSSGSTYPYGDSYVWTKCNTEYPYEIAIAGSYSGCRKEGSNIFDLVGNLNEWTAEGKLFGGSFLDGAYANCALARDPDQFPNSELWGFRCCVSPTDDLDKDGWQASLDCDDADPATHPQAEESCDFKDNDCDGKVDNAIDEDNDGWDKCQDCGDTDASINPGAPDFPGDQVDSNCDGVDGADVDHDGYFSAQYGGDDCNDNNATVRPGGVELCDGFDNDCDGYIDNNLPIDICNDNNTCTIDTCNKHKKMCQNTLITCNDDNPCTQDGCNQTIGCIFSYITGNCDDGNRCTINDSCRNGICLGTPKNCADNNVCTENGCNMYTGECIYTYNRRYCSDTNTCTFNETCYKGACKADAMPVECYDRNDCTNDSCDPDVGCKFTPRQGICEDGTSCTVGDTCVMGSCIAGNNVCYCTNDGDCAKYEDGDKCNGTLRCVETATSSVCQIDPETIVTCRAYQESACRAEVCNSATGMCQIVNARENMSCSDGNGCTLEDRCVGGECMGRECSDLGLLCVGSGCVEKTCSPFQRICDGDNATRQCTAGGDGWANAVMCLSGEYCRNGQCHKQTCEPGAPVCFGNIAGVCDVLGSGLTTPSVDCEAAGLLCRDGLCVACQPDCDGRRCGDDGCGGTCGFCGADQYCIFTNGLCERQDMIFVPASLFWMGSSANEAGRDADELLHQVSITIPFSIMKHEVTQSEFGGRMGYNPSQFKACGGDCPVDSVSWHEALFYANRLSDLAGVERCFDCTGSSPGFICKLKSTFARPQDCAGYRLPTEAEWEFAARSGTHLALFNGNVTFTDCHIDAALDAVAWYCANSGNTPHRTGSKQANGWDIRDMSGNVSEWVLDWYGPYKELTIPDPIGAATGSKRVARGGSWGDMVKECRSAARLAFQQDTRAGGLGFRLVRSLPGQCSDGTCICQQQCENKNCGPDGCGGSCGSCALDEYCALPYGLCTRNNMAFVESAAFLMGSPKEEPGHQVDETQHMVTLTRSFWIMREEVTQAEFFERTGNRPSFFQNCGDDCPVEQVSWDEAMEFANQASAFDGLEPCYACEQGFPSVTCSLNSVFDHPQDCGGYRLPTEAEWELAARAGTQATFFNGELTQPGKTPLDPNLDVIGWYGGNSSAAYEEGFPCLGWYAGAEQCGPHRVGKKLRNNLGIADASGNVAEWVWDFYEDYQEVAVDPAGATAGVLHVVRGGSWRSNATECRLAKRDFAARGVRSKSIGFRLARTRK